MRWAMMSPFDAAEKQALLEAPDLKTRAELLVAVNRDRARQEGHRRRDRATVTASARRNRYISR